jgi:hypothetical protein
MILRKDGKAYFCSFGTDNDAFEVGIWCIAEENLEM